MRKLKLDLEHLAVESFATAENEGQQGTVRAAQEGDTVLEPAKEGEEVAILSIWTCFTQCNQLTCNLSCAGTCYYDRTCNSCHITMCPTGASPECCA